MKVVVDALTSRYSASGEPLGLEGGDFLLPSPAAESARDPFPNLRLGQGLSLIHTMMLLHKLR
jgi:hypothetical protein